MAHPPFIFSSLTRLCLLFLLLLASNTATADPQPLSGQAEILERPADASAEYDYIVIGGGTAGLTMADRLTEDGKCGQFPTVHACLTKLASNADSRTEQIPSSWLNPGRSGLLDARNFFNFSSVSQVNLNNRTVCVVGGAMLGGSSGAWNFHPPHPALVKEFGIKFDASYWGTSSKVHDSFPSFLWPFFKTQIDAFKDTPGVDFLDDSGSGEPGAFWWPASVDPGPVLRSFSRPGQWDGESAPARPNYRTLTEQRVLKVVFENKTTGGCSSNGKKTKQKIRAAGILFVPTRARTVRARRKVVIAAGTIHTPQILQASGVGRADVLQRGGIDVVADLPGVGSNFQDPTYQVGALFNLAKFPPLLTSDLLLTNATFIAEAQALVLRGVPAQDPAAFLSLGPDATVVAGYRAQKRALAAALRSRGSAVYNLFLQGKAVKTDWVVYLHPLSRGTVHVDPRNPLFAPPLFDYRALNNPADVDVLVEFTRFTRRFFTTTRLAAYGLVELFPGAHVTAPEDIAAALRARLSPTVFHPVGNAAMMPRALGGVVDDKLQVYGVVGLSIADASKAADLIKARA
ncbi:GMC oxidoreductase-like protein [Lasiosphaeria ovina]|uniref:GMC oxidoreductase-like protein n=1 Tax=Lasiosphaeria ovina TaxID=92902 RepID=A0AAE0N2R5_9PEZI|nr:GMC oxidoreductase-like protein [Lasiosphaeria ovina]